MTAAGFVLVGTMFDIGTWYYSKNVKIFDEKENECSNESANGTANEREKLQN